MSKVGLLKRACDLTLGILLLIVFWPVILLISSLVLMKMGRPIFFTQRRAGRNGIPFTLFKFRTMSEPTEESTRLGSDFDRLTPLGAVLRSTSLDELPQILNIIKGDMSLVGPRPLLVEYLRLYDSEQARRHDVRPGLTGWAQVNGRNNQTWQERFQMDVWYVDHQSFLLDLKILILTVKKVLLREGVNASEQEPMKPFTGNKN